MNPRKFVVWIVLFFSSHGVKSQNLDLGLVHASGKYRGMAGSAMSATDAAASFDLNPGGLAYVPHWCLSMSQSLRYYSYSLYRRNEGVHAIIFDWNKMRYNLEHVLLAAPGMRNVCFGIGVVKKTNVYIDNYRRAITWSSLFHQETTGSMYALALSSGFKLNQAVSLGVTLYRYFGTITCEINGENHGTDSDKWAVLSHRFNGWNCRIGAVIGFKEFSAGFILEPSGQLDASTKKRSSADRSYQYLFPAYDRTEWNLPLIFGMGAAYKGFKNLILAFDWENQQFEKSNLQLNLFEFGGQPNWKDVNAYRVGVEISPFPYSILPLRLGYAYLPQSYASNNSIGQENVILEYTDTRQNVKHVFTIGTTIMLARCMIHITLEKGIVKWHRDLKTKWYVEDDYTENDYFLSTEIIYERKSTR